MHLLARAGAEPELEEERPAFAVMVEEPKKERTPRRDWAGLLRRTFALDGFACARCGGRRRVLASLTAPGRGARAAQDPGDFGFHGNALAGSYSM